ncbi:MAG: DUF1028 domain-containing protein [bacterium]|nr:DUF1028 domain-containing protein [bacterium]
MARSADGAWWGSAVASRCLAVGRAVPAAKVNVGAIATQAKCNLTYRERGLALLSSGVSAEEVVRSLVQDDEHRQYRQLGVVDAMGRASSHTGEDCNGWAGHVVGENYAIQGNFLSGPGVVAAMERAWLATDESDELERRMLAALLAGDRAGGDRRGRQSSAILIVTEAGAYEEGASDEYTNLRVDDHHDPVIELIRLSDIRAVHLVQSDGPGAIPLEGDVLGEIAVLLDRIGYPSETSADDAVVAALEVWAIDEYLSGRFHGDSVDVELLNVLRNRAGAGSLI